MLNRTLLLKNVRLWKAGVASTLLSNLSDDANVKNFSSNFLYLTKLYTSHGALHCFISHYSEFRQNLSNSASDISGI